MSDEKSKTKSDIALGVEGQDTPTADVTQEMEPQLEKTVKSGYSGFLTIGLDGQLKLTLYEEDAETLEPCSSAVEPQLEPTPTMNNHDLIRPSQEEGNEHCDIDISGQSTLTSLNVPAQASGPTTRVLSYCEVLKN